MHICLVPMIISIVYEYVNKVEKRHTFELKEVLPGLCVFVFFFKISKRGIREIYVIHVRLHV